MNDLKFWLAISQITQIGPKRFDRLRRFFPSMQDAWSANLTDLMAAGLEQKIAEDLIAKRQQINPDAELGRLQKENVSIITIEDEKYPALLKEIYNPPALLYFKGNLNNLHQRTIAVVGTRRITNYGRTVTPRLVEELINQDIIIVSGLALGVDTMAHSTAVKHGKMTVAVLGSGLDQQNIYPSSNRLLAEQIIDNNGLLISEYPLGTLPLKHNFPVRNRIISGLSLGTLVIEADENSGALITAQYALEQNREVFAIPGAITSPLSTGTNNLIKKGAKLVTAVEDILEELNIKQIKEFEHTQEIIPDSAEEAAILNYLHDEPLHINQIAQQSALPIHEISATLIMLEMKGKIRNVGNMTYSTNN